MLKRFKKQNLLRSFLLALLLIIISCNRNNVICENSTNIKVHSSLIKIAKGDYCSLLNRSFNKDRESIKEFCQLTLDENSGFYHGEILIELIGKLGEDFFIKSISNFDNHDRYKLRFYIYAGFFQKGRYKFSIKKTEDVFPKLYDFLKEEKG
jgi:hypothetical protein